MSVKNFHYIFCLSCQKDTLHYVEKCRDCGRVHEIPHEARVRVAKQLFSTRGGFLKILHSHKFNNTARHAELKRKGMTGRDLPERKPRPQKQPIAGWRAPTKLER